MSGENDESEFEDALESGEFENDWEDCDAHLLNDRRITELHPAMLVRVVNLTDDLRRRYAAGELKTRWLVFEAVRSAERQRYLLANDATPFQAWQSPHQYGLAIDMEAYDYNGNKITLPTLKQCAEMIRIAQTHGLVAPHPRNRAHLEHPGWAALRKIIFPPGGPQQAAYHA